jgi:serine/threonine-protein kinase
MTSEQVGPFTIERRLGAGGMGVVYQARDSRLGRLVALKLLPVESTPDPLAHQRLVREAQLASALNHPHVSTIYEVGESHGQTWIAMELVDGTPLREQIPRGGMPLGEALRLGLQIVDAVAHAHARGVIHRDLKVGNVLVSGQGDAKVLDFGLAKRVAQGVAAGPIEAERSLTGLGIVVGTPHAIAPEVLDGRPADARSDVWSLGVLLHEMLTGTPPFQGEHVIALAHAIMSQPPAELPDRVPAPIRDVVSRALSKDPAHRYADAGALRTALQEATRDITGLGLGGVAVGGRAPAQRPRWPWILGGVGAALGLGAIALAVRLGFDRAGLPLQPGGPSIRSLAVLPLANLSGDPSQDYFADGMTEELITDLAPISSLKVISRTSVMRYRNTRLAIPQIARELNVDGIVEGSVLRSGNKVRITAQLIDAPRDRHLWAESYERDLQDVIALQREVARDIANKIHARLTTEQAARMSHTAPVNPEAYELYLRGRHETFVSDDASVRRGIDYFQKAIALDPGDARYHAGLADAYLVLAQIVGSMPFRQALPLVRAHAERALRIDPQRSEANMSMGVAVMWTERDLHKAERYVRRALSLSPNDATVRVVYSVILDAQGREDESLREARVALDLDPLSPLTQHNLAWALCDAGRPEESVAVADRVIGSAAPGAQAMMLIKQRALEALKRYPDVVTMLRTASPEWVDGPAAADLLQRGLQRGGARGYWTAMRDVQRIARTHRDSQWLQAVIDAQLGENDAAFAALDRAFDNWEGEALFLKVDPLIAPLRTDPRFPKRLARLGLTP